MIRFDKIFVISLKDRKDRLDEFFKELPNPWLFGDIEVFDAIDGYTCKIPSKWKSGKGAWGCYQSHLQLISQCLYTSNINNVLIFEDDAIFIDHFNDKASVFFDALPQDWEMAYLGGQHLEKPKDMIIADTVGIGTNINRTHAYCINTKNGMEKIVNWLNRLDLWKSRHHIDHHYGRLHKDQSIIAYCPLHWLVGQRKSFSNITRKNTSTRWWC